MRNTSKIKKGKRKKREKRVMRKLVKSCVMVLCFAVAVIISASVSLLAKPKVVEVKEDYSTTFEGKGGKIDVAAYVSRLYLVGDSAAYSKINKALKKLSNSYSPDNIYSYAQSDTEQNDAAKRSDTYHDTVDAVCTYLGKKYISVALCSNWYAGGVSNTGVAGYVFNLKTGKRAYITKVSGKSLDYIKERLIANIHADGEFEDFDFEPVIKDRAEKDFSFYINEDGLCVVTFAPYELGWGGWTREYVIE